MLETVTATVTRPTDEKQKLTFAAERTVLSAERSLLNPMSFDIEIIGRLPQSLSGS